MTTAITLPSLKLSEAERDSAALLRRQLQRVALKNKFKADLYEGKHTAEDLGISAPAGLPGLIEAVIGWPGTVVDVLEERLEFQGWTGVDDLKLQDVMIDNDLADHLATTARDCVRAKTGFGADHHRLGTCKIGKIVRAQERPPTGKQRFRLP